MIQIRAAANNATPTNSRTRRETVDLFTSNLHDDRQHERSTARTLPEEPAQFGPQLFLDDALVGPFLEAGLIHHIGQNPGAVGEQRFAVFHDEPARDDVGHAFERPRLLVDRDDWNDQAVFSEMSAIAENFVADLAGARAVDQHASHRRFAGNARAFVIELNDIAILREKNSGPRFAPCKYAAGHAGVPGELTVLAMYRHEVAGSDERQHQLELFLATVSRHMDVLDTFVYHVRAAPGDVVQDASDRF